MQSVPGQDEKPQTFETVEKIEARAEWNAMKPRLTEKFIPTGLGHGHVYLKGTATNLKPGDAILLVGPERENDFRSERWNFRRRNESNARSQGRPHAHRVGGRSSQGLAVQRLAISGSEGVRVTSARLVVRIQRAASEDALERGARPLYSRHGRYSGSRLRTGRSPSCELKRELI